MTSDAITAIQQDHRLLEGLFERLRNAAPDERAPAFERTRLAGLRAAGLDAPAAPPAQGGADELAEATRDELYEMAKEADIPGRSSMKKDDLAEALREQT
jgi:hypothetical protein